jgi:chromosome segregation ATPase
LQFFSRLQALEVIGGIEMLKQMSPQLVAVLVADLNNHLLAMGEPSLQDTEMKYLISLAGQGSGAYRPNMMSSSTIPTPTSTPAPVSTPAPAATAYTSSYTASKAAPAARSTVSATTPSYLASKAPSVPAPTPVTTSATAGLSSQPLPGIPASQSNEDVGEDDPLMMPMSAQASTSARFSASRHSRNVPGRIDFAKDEAIELRKQLSEAHLQLSDLRVEKDKLERAMNQLKRSMESQQQETEQQQRIMQTEVTELKNQLTVKQAQLTAELASRRGDSEVNQQLHRALAQVADMTNELKQIKTERNGMEEQLKKASVTASHVRVAESQAEVLRHELSKSTALISALKQEREDCVRALESERLEWESRSAILRQSDAATISELQEQCEKLASSISHLNLTESDLRSELGRVRSEMSSQINIAREFTLGDIERERRARESVENENAQFKRRIAELEADMSRLEGSASQVAVSKEEDSNRKIADLETARKRDEERFNVDRTQLYVAIPLPPPFLIAHLYIYLFLFSPSKSMFFFFFSKTNHLPDSSRLRERDSLKSELESERGRFQQCEDTIANLRARLQEKEQEVLAESQRSQQALQKQREVSIWMTASISHL